MKIVEITGKKKLALANKPRPIAVGEFVVIKIIVAPMCTEYKYYLAGDMHRPFGHEAAGEVVEVAQPGKLKVGDRVVGMPRYACGKCNLCLAGDFIYCQNRLNVSEIIGSNTGIDTYAQYYVKQDWLLAPIPEGISYEHGSMACCGLGPTLGAMELMNVNAFDTILITGLGPVGLGGVINAVYRAARVIAVDINPFRTNLAIEIGAEAVIDPRDPDALKQIMSLTNGIGVDKAIDCSGVPSAQRLMIDATRRKGQASFIGEGGELNINVSKDMLRKGLTLHGVWHYNLGTTPKVFEVIEKSPGLIDKVITHKFPLEQIQEAFEMQLTGKCGKVLLYPWE